MSDFNRSNVYEASGSSLRDYILQVFTRMGIGLGLTALTAYACYRNLMAGGALYTVLVNYYSVAMMAVAIAQLGICVVLSTRLTRMSTGTATGLFYGYAVLTGVTFSILPLAFGASTVFGAFLFAAILFGCCCVIGYTTNVDLTRFSGLLMGGLIALVVVSLLSWFIPVLRENLMFSYLGIVIFLGLTAWDMQRIKAIYDQSAGYGDLQGNYAIFGAFQLYLDFINIFLYVLRILGSRNRK